MEFRTSLFAVMKLYFPSVHIAVYLSGSLQKIGGGARIQYRSIFCSKIVWFTVSNALEKSKNTPQEYRLSFIALRKLSAISAMACEVKCPFLKPN